MDSDASTAPTVLGGDFGNGNSKLTGQTGSTVIQTMVSSGGTDAYDEGSLSGNLIGVKTLTPPPRIEFDRLCFYVGTNAHYFGHSSENFGLDGMSGTRETQALVYETLSEHFKARPMPESIILYVGLPHQFTSGENRKTTGEMVRRWMTGKHEWSVNGKFFTVHIEDVQVTSQASAALFDYLLDEAGKIVPERNELFKGDLGVISLGFGTIEMLATTEGKAVQKWTSGRSIGVRRLLELTNEDEHNTLAQLDAKLRSGRLDVKALIPIWEREVTSMIEKCWGTSWKKFSQVVIVGGGTAYIGASLERFFRGKALIMNDPVISISRGLYKKGLNSIAKGASK